MGSLLRAYLKDVIKRRYLLLTAVLWGLIIAFGYWYILTLCVNVPNADNWRFIELLISWHEGRLGVVDFLKAHTDSRITVPLFMHLPLLILTSGNLKALYLIDFTLYLLFLFTFMIFLKKDLSIKSGEFIILLTPFLLYSLNTTYLDLFIYQICAFTYPVMYIFSMLTVYFLSNAGNSYRALLAAILAGYACSFSFATGFPIWIAGLLQLLLQRVRNPLKICIWCFAAIIFLITHFILLGEPPYFTPDPSRNLDAYVAYVKTFLFYPLHKFICFLSVIGMGLFYYFPPIALFLGIITFIILALMIYVNRYHILIHSKWYTLLIFGILIVLELVMARSGDIAGISGPPDRVFLYPDIRHALAIYLPINCIYALAIIHYHYSKSDRIRKFNRRLRNAIAVLLILSFTLQFLPGLYMGVKIHNALMETRDIILSFEVRNDDELLKTYALCLDAPCLERLKEGLTKLGLLNITINDLALKMSRMKSLKLSCFSENSLLGDVDALPLWLQKIHETIRTLEEIYDKVKESFGIYK